MKNNSFKYSGPTFKDLVKNLNKKFVLTAVLAAVLSGPYIFQVSSKDFFMSEFASEAEATEEGYAVMKAAVLKQIISVEPTKAGMKEIPPDSDITDPTAKALAARANEMRTQLEKKKIDTAVKEANDAATKAAKDKADLAKKEKDDAEAAVKKAKDEAAEKKKLDCSDKDKKASEQKECREEAKAAEKLKKQEENEEKFVAEYEKANQKCIDKARTKDTSDELELKCHSQGFAVAINKFKSKKDGELSVAFVNEQFKDIVGNDLFKMLFSEDGSEVERANVILSNLFAGKIPNQIKRLVIDETRRKATAEKNKVVAEFKKANRYAKNSTEYTAQYAVATAAQDQFGEKLFSHGGAMYNSMYRVGDTDGLAYYRSAYLGNNERINKDLLAASLGTIGGEAGAAARNAATRNGLSTTTEAGATATKMTRTGVSYTLQSPGTAQNISIGTPSSDRVGDIRHGIRVNQ